MASGGRVSTPGRCAIRNNPFAFRVKFPMRFPNAVFGEAVGASSSNKLLTLCNYSILPYLAIIR